MRRSIFQHVDALLSTDFRRALDALLVTTGSRGPDTSPLQALKEPPGPASPRSLLREIDKLETIQATGAVGVDLSWLRSTLKKALARRVRHSSAYRLRDLTPGHRYAAVLCFLQETRGGTVDQLVDLHAKLMTQTYRRAQNRLDNGYREHRRSLVGKLSSLRTIGALVLDDTVSDRNLRAEILKRIPTERLQDQIQETERWLKDKTDVFPRVADRFGYFRQFSPRLLEHLRLETESAIRSPEAVALLESVELLRGMNSAGKRRLRSTPLSLSTNGRLFFGINSVGASSGTGLSRRCSAGEIAHEHLDWIADQWDRMAQFFCSMATGHTTASVAMKRLVAFGPHNHLYRAIRELGRAFKTHFILEYLAQPELRRRVRQGLLKSEQLHALARSVFYGKLGRADWRDFRRQMSTASCLLTILAAVVYWQIREIERVLGDIDPEDDVPVDLLSHISPISWDNVVLYGEYKLRPELVETGSA